METFAAGYRTRLLTALGAIPLDKVDQAIEWLRAARGAGRSVYVCGNGGSALSASHFVCDMVKSASYQRPERFRIQALTDSLATITAYANDVSYDSVFVEQLRNFATPGDVLIAVSGSGNSPNVLRAVEYANSAGLKTIGLAGRDGGSLAPLCQLAIHVPEAHMGRIEDAHMAVLHMICYYFIDTEMPAA